MKLKTALLLAFLSLHVLTLHAQGKWDTTTTGTVLTTTADSVGIGTSQPQSKLHLNNGDFLISKNGTANFLVTQDGLIRGREILIDLDPIPDYVFGKSYKLMNLYELEQYINTNHHLPNIPGECEFYEKGALNVGELQMKLLEKIEELTLYIIALQKENDVLKGKIEQLEKQLSNH